LEHGGKRRFELKGQLEGVGLPDASEVREQGGSLDAEPVLRDQFDPAWHCLDPFGFWRGVHGFKEKERCSVPGLARSRAEAPIMRDCQ